MPIRAPLTPGEAPNAATTNGDWPTEVYRGQYIEGSPHNFQRFEAAVCAAARSS